MGNSTRTTVESERARIQINDSSISLNFAPILAYFEDEAGIGVVRTQAVGECRSFKRGSTSVGPAARTDVDGA